MTLQQSPQRSVFVSTLAWTTLAVNFFGVLGSLLQLWLLDDLLLTLRTVLAASAPGLPLPVETIRMVSWLTLAFSIFAVWGSYALAQRREWARQTFVALLLLGIVLFLWWIAALLLGASAMLSGSTDSLGMPTSTAAAIKAMLWTLVLLVLALCALHAWLIRRLMSPDIKAEFVAAPKF